VAEVVRRLLRLLGHVLVVMVEAVVDRLLRRVVVALAEGEVGWNLCLVMVEEAEVVVGGRRHLVVEAQGEPKLEVVEVGATNGASRELVVEEALGHGTEVVEARSQMESYSLKMEAVRRSGGRCLLAQAIAPVRVVEEVERHLIVLCSWLELVALWPRERIYQHLQAEVEL